MFASTLLIIAGTLAAPAPKDKKAEPLKLDGAWVIERYVAGGQDEPKRQGHHMEFAAGGVVVREEKGFDVAYSVDLKKTPAQLDLMAGKDLALPGIFKIEGDTLTICFPKGGGERPQKFESPDGTNIVLMVLKREKK